MSIRPLTALISTLTCISGTLVTNIDAIPALKCILIDDPTTAAQTSFSKTRGLHQIAVVEPPKQVKKAPGKFILTNDAEFLTFLEFYLVREYIEAQITSYTTAPPEELKAVRDELWDVLGLDLFIHSNFSSPGSYDYCRPDTLSDAFLKYTLRELLHLYSADNIALVKELAFRVAQGKEIKVRSYKDGWVAQNIDIVTTPSASFAFLEKYGGLQRISFVQVTGVDFYRLNQYKTTNILYLSARNCELTKLPVLDNYVGLVEYNVSDNDFSGFDDLPDGVELPNVQFINLYRNDKLKREYIIDYEEQLKKVYTHPKLHVRWVAIAETPFELSKDKAFLKFRLLKPVREYVEDFIKPFHEPRLLPGYYRVYDDLWDLLPARIWGFACQCNASASQGPFANMSFSTLLSLCPKSPLEGNKDLLEEVNLRVNTAIEAMMSQEDYASCIRIEGLEIYMTPGEVICFLARYASIRSVYFIRSPGVKIDVFNEYNMKYITHLYVIECDIRRLEVPYSFIDLLHYEVTENLIPHVDYLSDEFKMPSLETLVLTHNSFIPEQANNYEAKLRTVFTNPNMAIIGLTEPSTKHFVLTEDPFFERFSHLNAVKEYVENYIKEKNVKDDPDFESIEDEFRKVLSADLFATTMFLKPEEIGIDRKDAKITFKTVLIQDPDSNIENVNVRSILQHRIDVAVAKKAGELAGVFSIGEFKMHRIPTRALQFLAKHKLIATEVFEMSYAEDVS